MKSEDAGVKNSILTTGGEKKRRHNRIGEIKKKNSDNICEEKTLAILKGPFKTLCFLNYALMICQDYDITSSLRRGALQVITTSPPILPIEDPNDSLIMGNEDLNTIPEKESDEFIKSSVEDLVSIPSEFEDTSGIYSECIFPSCNDFSPINIFEKKSVTFSNPLFDSNDDFTFNDDESLSDEDVSEDNVKVYSNPLFEFDDEYISSEVNPLFDEVLENIESKDSYDSNLDEPD
nr:hypothetical protein [Tanacetum cinerariifolium]